MILQASLADLIARIPGAPSAQWPQGERYALAFSQGTMSVGYYAPVGADPQGPHQRDEVYIVHRGHAHFVLESERASCRAGDVLFVPAGAVHRFEDLSPDFATWVVFWGPRGGEAAAQAQAKA